MGLGNPGLNCATARRWAEMRAHWHRSLKKVPISARSNGSADAENLNAESLFLAIHSVDRVDDGVEKITRIVSDVQIFIVHQNSISFHGIDDYCRRFGISHPDLLNQITTCSGRRLGITIAGTALVVWSSEISYHDVVVCMFEPRKSFVRTVRQIDRNRQCRKDTSLTYVMLWVLIIHPKNLSLICIVGNISKSTLQLLLHGFWNACLAKPSYFGQALLCEFQI